MRKKEVNPFLAHTPLEVIMLEKSAGNLKATYDGEELPGTLSLTRRYPINRETFTPVFATHRLGDQFYSLSSKSKNLVWYIIQHIPKDTDVMRLDYREVTSVCGMSERSYYDGIKEIEAAGYISKKHAKDYWVNPHFIFRGNRYRILKTKYGKEVIDYKANIRSNQMSPLS